MTQLQKATRDKIIPPASRSFFNYFKQKAGRRSRTHRIAAITIAANTAHRTAPHRTHHLNLDQGLAGIGHEVLDFPGVDADQAEE